MFLYIYTGKVKIICNNKICSMMLTVDVTIDLNNRGVSFIKIKLKIYFISRQ